MGEGLKKFGKYYLLDHLAQGGMAEIYRARLGTVDGAGRLIVIKKIQTGYGANKEFLQMFQSEIKVTMGFNHPNIVQLYDFGEQDNQPYIAMELVDGRNLRQFMTRFAEMKQTFPVDLAAYIIEQAAAGLHYAHSYRDKISGEPLSIVHRDVSPQNILISFEGNVKVIDFGIAKASTNSESTRAGVIKGKPSYLSPEQISGDQLDGRSDIFALGTVLWELLVGRKLFAGESDLAVLKLIESCQTYVKPPSTLNPKVPKELDYIVLRSLTKQKEKRYQTAEEMQRALHKFIYGFSPDFNPTDLSYYAKDLFKNQIVEDRKNIQKLNASVEELMNQEAAQPTPETPGKTAEPFAAARPASNTPALSTPAAAPLISFNEATMAEPKLEFEKAPKTTANQAPPVRNRANSTQAPLPTRARQTLGTHQSLPSQNSSDASPPLTKYLLLGVGGILILAILGPSFGIKVPVLSDQLSELTRDNEARLVLEGDVKNVVVSMDGRPIANALPAIITGFPIGSPFRVTVTGESGVFQRDFIFKKGESKRFSVTLIPSENVPATSSGNSIPTLTTSAAAKAVLLRLNISPGGGGSTSIQLNGKTLDSTQPVAQVPLDSPLELVINREGFKPFTSQFIIDSNQVNGQKEWSIDTSIEPLQYGTLTLHTTPSANATLTLTGRPNEKATSWTKKTPIENEKLPIGNYSIRLVNDVLGMEKVISTSIQEAKAVNLDERLELKK